MSESPIDLERVRRFVAGDAAAFEEIVRAYQGRIVTLCRYLLGNAADADDAAPEIDAANVPSDGVARLQS